MKQILVALVLLWAMPSFAGYKEGTEAFERGDNLTALKEFQALAENNDARGQYGLGVMHDMGQGVPENQKEAAKWYQLAAEQGHVDAQNNLGVMYENGEGVGRNYEEAMRWYLKAAESGNRDAAKAFMWFHIAGKGDPAAASNKKFLMKRISTDEVAQAESLANEWLMIRNQNKAGKNERK